MSPGWTGVGPNATFGRSSRAALARFTNNATRNGSLMGRSPGWRGNSTPDDTSTAVAGMVRSVSATVAGVSPPASITGTSRAIAATVAASARTPVPPPCGPPAVSMSTRSTPRSSSVRAAAT